LTLVVAGASDVVWVTACSAFPECAVVAKVVTVQG
jgi:hypothetical protein